MDLFMSIAVLLGLAALFGVLNERFLRLQATIGLMLLALALALSLPDSPEKTTIVNMTYAVVTFSILVQGSTMSRLFKPEFLRGLVKST